MLYATNVPYPYSTQNVNWTSTQNPEFPYHVVIDNVRWVIRLNDFPSNPLYTLLIDDRAVMDFDDWPYTWKR
jgi:hypothetical protein